MHNIQLEGVLLITRVFIDGSAGTTGLMIHSRLKKREDLTLISLREETRKDPDARAKALNGADIAFLCLPDGAAIHAVEMIANPNTVVIDTSTAHRTSPGWTYGFPELAGREAVASSRRIANPGCHASGFVALVQPLVKAGLLKRDASLACFSLTGYSGGGKAMIAQYEDRDRSALLRAPRQYGLTQAHKHLREMQTLCGLVKAPLFSPVVADFYSGMEVTVLLEKEALEGGPGDIRALYRNTYAKGLVRCAAEAEEGGFLSAAAFSGRDDMEVGVYGNEERIALVARFDNLGKGASGAAIQNMNIVLGLPEDEGLIRQGVRG